MVYIRVLKGRKTLLQRRNVLYEFSQFSGGFDFDGRPRTVGGETGIAYLNLSGVEAVWKRPYDEVDSSLGSEDGAEASDDLIVERIGATHAPEGMEDGASGSMMVLLVNKSMKRRG